MNGKERIARAMDLDGNPPDRVPFDGLLPWRSDQFTMVPILPSSFQPPEPYYPYLEAPILAKIGLYRWKPSWKPPKNWTRIKREAMDDWGCFWTYTDDDPTKGHPGKPAFQTWDDMEDWSPPDGSDPGRVSFMGRLSKLFPRKYKIANLGSFLFSRCQYLRGFSNILVDFRRNASKVKELLKRMVPYYLDLVDAWAKYKPDAIMTQDDMGTQTGPFTSPKIYREFFMEPFKQIVNHVHDLGMKFILHSCGKVNPLVPIWKEIGIDALQFDSPHQTGIDEMAEYRGQFCFWDVVDIQTIYPFGTPADVEAEVKRLIKTFATPNGGLVLRDYLGATSVLKVPPANVKAFRAAARKHGKYPIK